MVSSMIKNIAYHYQQEVLEVTFQTGQIYAYFGVPHEIYYELMLADSKGRYMHDYILNHYDSAPVSQNEAHLS